MSPYDDYRLTSGHRQELYISILLLLALAIIVSGILVGQYLRAERAANVDPAQEYTAVIHVPPGYNCEGSSDLANSTFVVSCEPFK